MKKENVICFKDRIFELRSEAGLTQQELAKAISFGKSIVYYWENGEREPNTKALIALSAFFNVSIEYLLGLSNDDRSSRTDVSCLTENETKLLKAYMLLDISQRENLIRQAQTLSTDNNTIHSLTDSEADLLKFFRGVDNTSQRATLRMLKSLYVEAQALKGSKAN